MIEGNSYISAVKPAYQSGKLPFLKKFYFYKEFIKKLFRTRKAVIHGEGMAPVYLKRIKDGATTNAIAVTEKLKVDYMRPRINSVCKDQDGNNVDIYDSVYADTIEFTIYDEHLKSVIFNGLDMSVSDNSATIVLDSDGGKSIYTIKAFDDAGNIVEILIILVPEAGA